MSRKRCKVCGERCESAFRRGRPSKDRPLEPSDGSTMSLCDLIRTQKSGAVPGSKMQENTQIPFRPDRLPTRSRRISRKTSEQGYE